MVNATSFTVLINVGVGTFPIGIGLTPRGEAAYVTNASGGTVSVLSLTGMPAFSQNIITVAGGLMSKGNTMVSPAILRASDGVMNVSGDPDLVTAGFKGYVTLAGGQLTFTNDLAMSRELSLVGGASLVSSTIDTNGFDVTLTTNSSGDATAELRKLGAGTLVLPGAHSGHSSRLEAGRLLVNGTHTALLTVDGANVTLGGSGIVGSVDVVNGTLAPGAMAQGTGVLQVGNLTMSSTGRLDIALDSATPGSYGAVQVTGTATINGAELVVTPGFVPPVGTVFTILNNTTGTFAQLPEGAIFLNGGARYRISYTGGTGDDVTLTVVNLPPTLSTFVNQTFDEDAQSVPAAFTVDDIDDPRTSLVTTVTSSNTTLFPNGSLTLTGTSASSSRQILMTPAPNLRGTATITLRVADSYQHVERTFDVTVTPINDAPTIDAIGPQTIAQDSTLTPVAFGIADIDIDDPVNGLTITLSSSNQTLLPDANLTAGGTGATRTAAATPAVGQFGSAIITVTVSDGEATASTTFTLTVTKAPAPPPPPPPPAPAGITYSLAEGATGSFFETDILLANPNMIAVPVTMTFLKPDGTSIVASRELAALSRTTVQANQIAGLDAATFSVTVKTENSLPIAVERTVRWDASGYGAHTEKASMGESTTWVFAEGSQGYFSTFLLIANPRETDNVAHVTWLRQGEGPLTRDYSLKAASRTTIDTGTDTELLGRSFGASVTFDQPGMAERAMYFGSNPLWTGGHAASGANAASTTWYLAEGATGSFFTTYVLIANPGAEPADVTLNYFTDGGEQISITETLPAGQRMTRNVAFDPPSLANTSFATRVTSTQPVVVERAQYWGSPAWIESHNSLGVTAPNRRWALAEGRVGGADGAQSYILLANFGTDTTTVTLTFLRENNAMPIVKTIDVAAGMRVTVGVTGHPSSLVPELTTEAFGTLIESTQPIVVERSLYSNANGVIWAAGTNATGTPIAH